MRVTSRTLAALAVIVFGAACGEPTAVQTPTAPRFAPSSKAPSFDFSSAGRLGIAGSDFTLTPAGGSFQVGLFTVNFPAGSVCDPSASTYGPTEWDKSCVPLSGSKAIAMHASVQLTPTGLAVDFQPQLRFVPTSQVTISTDIFAPLIVANRQFFQQNPAVLRTLAMYYSPSLGAGHVADYQVDPSLITHINLTTGRIWRRVKHFSGYVLGSGEPCTPSPDNPDCIQVDSEQ